MHLLSDLRGDHGEGDKIPSRDALLEDAEMQERPEPVSKRIALAARRKNTDLKRPVRRQAAGRRARAVVVLFDYLLDTRPGLFANIRMVVQYARDDRSGHIGQFGHLVNRHLFLHGLSLLLPEPLLITRSAGGACWRQPTTKLGNAYSGWPPSFPLHGQPPFIRLFPTCLSDGLQLLMPASIPVALYS